MGFLSLLAEEALAEARKLDAYLDSQNRPSTSFDEDTLTDLPLGLVTARNTLIDRTHTLKQLALGPVGVLTEIMWAVRKTISPLFPLPYQRTQLKNTISSQTSSPSPPSHPSISPPTFPLPQTAVFLFILSHLAPNFHPLLSNALSATPWAVTSSPSPHRVRWRTQRRPACSITQTWGIQSPWWLKRSGSLYLRCLRWWEKDQRRRSRRRRLSRVWMEGGVCLMFCKKSQKGQGSLGGQWGGT